MRRLLVHVEGQTEETFVNEVLKEYLCRRGYSAVSARIVGNARLRHKRGGIRPWTAVCTEIVRHLKEDPACIATTMVDYYGLPQLGSRPWPGRNQSGRLPSEEKASRVEEGMLRDVTAGLGSRFDPRRFVPFVVMHEFEALLFSDCAAFSRGIGRPSLEADFRSIRGQFKTPEEINDSPDTAPSKRVLGLAPNYQKPLHGPLAALEIGLDCMRNECPGFHAWLQRLESAAGI